MPLWHGRILCHDLRNHGTVRSGCPWLRSRLRLYCWLLVLRAYEDVLQGQSWIVKWN